MICRVSRSMPAPCRALICQRSWAFILAGASSVMGGAVAAAAMQADYRPFQVEVGALLAPRRLDPDDRTHGDFLFAVGDWIAARAEPIEFCGCPRARQHPTHPSG